MSKLSLWMRTAIVLSILLNQSQPVSAYCGNSVTASRVGDCQWVSSSGNHTESYYCAVKNTLNGPWACSSSTANNCKATLGGGTSCSTVTGTGNCTCSCETSSGVPIAGNCSGLAAHGRACGSGIPYSGTCQCGCSAPGGPGCGPIGGGGSVSCWVADPTVTPGGSGSTPRPPGLSRTPAPPTNTPRLPTITLTPRPPTNTPVPPTLTPIPPTATPVIMGRIYDDPNDGSVGISGNICIKTSGPGPTPVVLTNASIQAVRSSTGVISTGLITGSTYTITSGLVATAGNGYDVLLTLPTPAGTSTLNYVCGCPIEPGNDYLCRYSSISPNGSPNFFVKKTTLANAWWQTVGGSVYAKDAIQTQIPVSTCTPANNCTSALIVGTGTNRAGFALLGTEGILKTTSTGEATYVQSAGSRTTADGAYATGVKPGTETFDYFQRNLSDQPVSFISLSDLQVRINALSADSTGIFLYTGSGDLIIDKMGPTPPVIIPAKRKVIVFALTNIQFNNSSGDASSQLTQVPVGSFLIFLTQGNISIDPSVGHTNPVTVPTITNANLTGVFVADQQIIIQGDGDTTLADRKFIGAGTFVGWDTSRVGNGVELQRNFANSTSGTAQNSITPAEVFVYRPDFVANFPTELKTAHFNWQERAPQKVD